jgi:hypothetical protein
MIRTPHTLYPATNPHAGTAPICGPASAKSIARQLGGIGAPSSAAHHQPIHAVNLKIRGLRRVVTKRFTRNSTQPTRLRQQGALSAAKRQSSLDRADSMSEHVWTTNRPASEQETKGRASGCPPCIRATLFQVARRLKSPNQRHASRAGAASAARSSERNSPCRARHL